MAKERVRVNLRERFDFIRANIQTVQDGKTLAKDADKAMQTVRDKVAAAIENSPARGKRRLQPMLAKIDSVIAGAAAARKVKAPVREG